MYFELFFDIQLCRLSELGDLLCCQLDFGAQVQLDRAFMLLLFHTFTNRMCLVCMFLIALHKLSKL